MKERAKDALSWVLTAAVIAVICGGVMLWRRTPEAALLWVAVMFIACLAFGAVRGRRGEPGTGLGSLLAEIAEDAIIGIPLWCGTTVAILNDESAASAIGVGLAFGSVAIVVTAFFDWRDRRRDAGEPGTPSDSGEPSGPAAA